MFDERAFVNVIETASVEDLASLLAHPDREEETALRVYFGDDRYQRMRGMALKQNAVRQKRGTRGALSADKRGNVVVIHGIMGANLSSFDNSGGSHEVWVNILRLIAGAASQIRLADDGLTPFDPKFDIRATGMNKRAYGEILLSLSANWNVRPFWFDWRKNLNIAAAELDTSLKSWFPENEPVHIVAHSMGGLVARTFIKNHSDHWESMFDRNPVRKRGGRLIMLGTPNYGSFVIPQAMVGVEGIVKKLELADFLHGMDELLDVLNSFVGSYQMLPWPPLAGNGTEQLYDAATYTPVRVSDAHLRTALTHYDQIKDVVDTHRMIYIAGHNRPTFDGIRDWRKLDDLGSYTVTLNGDGRVPHSLGILRDLKNGKQEIDTYYVEENHGDLPSNPSLLAVLDELLETGATERLPRQAPAARRAPLNEGEQDALRDRILDEQNAEADRLRYFARRIETRSIAFSTNYAARGVDENGLRSSEEETLPLGTMPTADERTLVFSARSEAMTRLKIKEPAPAFLTYLSPEERDLEETLTRGVLGYPASTDLFMRSVQPTDKVKINIKLLHDNIENVTDDSIDAIAVGHYLGVTRLVGNYLSETGLQASEEAIDRAISAAMPGVTKKAKDLKPSDLLLTQYAARGIIRGDLGQTFFIPDPRVSAGKRRPGGTERLIVIAGMGVPGRFGLPELTVMVRELCWAVGRIGKRHMATVLIGNFSIPVRSAIFTWVAGIESAMRGSAGGGPDEASKRLSTITFVIRDPGKMLDADDALQDLTKARQTQDLLDNGILDLQYEPMTDKQRDSCRRKDSRYRAEKQRERLKKQQKEQEEQQDGESVVYLPVTHITFERDGNTYRFGALTDDASIPERNIPLDPKLVETANNEMAAEQVPVRQYERGQFMAQLLIPTEMQANLRSSGPLVMLLDSSIARLHWEIMALPDALDQRDGSSGPNRAGANSTIVDINRYLGIGRYFTRQLRTTFAPPPEPPPPPERLLRVLVVADPAEDMHLPGAEEGSGSSRSV